jgi:hypothetical protein
VGGVSGLRTTHRLRGPRSGPRGNKKKAPGAFFFFLARRRREVDAVLRASVLKDDVLRVS